MKLFPYILIGGAAALYLSKASNMGAAVKKLQFGNPKIKLGKVTLLNVEAEISIDVFNPTTTDIPVDYLTGNILYNGRQLSRFNVDGKATRLSIRAQSTTKVVFTVIVSNINGITTLSQIIANLINGGNQPIVLQVQGTFYALGVEVPFGFYYDVIRQRVVTAVNGIAGKAAVNGIAGVKASLEFSSNAELEKYFGKRHAAKKMIFSKN